MIATHLTLLLCIVYNVQSVVSTTTQLPEYPCNQNILFGFENSNKMDVFTFQRQMSFLTNQVFEQWTHFDQLALISNADDDFKEFGSFSSKSDVQKYLQSIINPTYSICGAFLKMSDQEVTNTKIILFASEFQSSDIRNDCILSLQYLISTGNEFVFIPLSNQFNRTVLKQYFKQAKIIEWDVINDEVPKDWEEQFNDFYGCSNSKSTTIGHSSASTINPIIPYPPCNLDHFVIALDKSTGFSSQEYQQIQTLLIDHAFKNWTRFGQQLAFYSFADNVYSTAVPFQNKDDLIGFIQNEEQIVSDPNFCNLFYNVFYNYYDSPKNHELERTNKQPGFTCKQYLSANSDTQLMFVILNNDVDTDALREYTPQSQFIKLDLSKEIPKNLEWQLNTAYGCNRDNYDDKSVYPCNSKFIFAYEDVLDQRNFLINGVFNSDWNVFDNLALIAYSNETMIQDFGMMSNAEDAHNFIDESFKQNVSSTSLCSVFKDLMTLYIQEVNIILFVNNFHEQAEHDECTLWIKQLREKTNTINFVVLNKHVNIEYLALKFPQATFTSWNPAMSTMPDNWSIESYGCQNFVVSGKYPCRSDLIDNIVVYDRSNYLSPVGYQNLEYFLLMRVFIKQWLDTVNVEVYSYPDDKYLIGQEKTELTLFIRQNLKSTQNPVICPILQSVNEVKSSTSTLLFFVSKFDKDVFAMDKECKDSVNDLNKLPKITFIKLKLFDDTLLRTTFPSAAIVDWDIEQNRELANWNQILWTAFGCSGNSSIILPSPRTSTHLPPTAHSLTTTKLTRKSSTTLGLSTQKQLTKSSTASTAASSTYTVTTHFPSSKPPIALIVILSTLIPLFVVCLTASLIGFCWYRRRERDQTIENMAFDDAAETSNVYTRIRNQIDLWKLDPESVELFVSKKLGSGASANVYLGKLTGDAGIKRVYPDLIALRHFHDCEVAIKMLPFFATDLNKEDFKEEINFMKALKYHPHILCMLGYTNDQIVLEYCANGDLMNFLNRNRTDFDTDCEDCLKPKDLISFSWQIANGMEYFSGLSFVHRDLAARNVLLTVNLVCKLSDFGLSREGNLQFYTSKKRLPVRWLPPEAIKSSEYTAKTDVWSYGILLYEVFTLGDFPYSGLDNEEILSHIESGNRLEQPEHASDEIYSIMSSCWTSASDQRPTFTEICQKLTPILDFFNINYNYVNPIETVADEANESAVVDDCHV